MKRREESDEEPPTGEVNADLPVSQMNSPKNDQKYKYKCESKGQKVN